MSLYKDPKSPNWQVSISVKGHPRIQRSTGTPDKAEAQRIHDEWKAAAYQRRAVGHTWQDAAAEWLNAGQRGDPDRYRLRIFTEAIGNPPLNDLTTDTIVSTISKKGPGNYNRYKNLILAILNHARLIGWIDNVPTIPSRKNPPGRLRWFTQEEFARLYAELPEHLKAPAAFAVTTGLRQANVIGLQWQDIDLQRKVMWVHPDAAKARKAIGIPLSEDAIGILRSQIGRHDTHVFTYRRGSAKPAPMKEIGEAYNRALQRAGIVGANWHTLRHTWASWHVMNGTPLEVLQKLGGWSSFSMVLKYAHLAPEYLASYAGNANRHSNIFSNISIQFPTVSGSLKST